jgi:hypothetical protein
VQNRRANTSVIKAGQAGETVTEVGVLSRGARTGNNSRSPTVQRLNQIPPKPSQNPGFQLAKTKEVVLRRTADKGQVTTTCSRQVPSEELEGQVSAKCRQGRSGARKCLKKRKK